MDGDWNRFGSVSQGQWLRLAVAEQQALRVLAYRHGPDCVSGRDEPEGHIRRLQLRGGATSKYSNDAAAEIAYFECNLPAGNNVPNPGKAHARQLILAFQARFTDIQGHDIRDICYATQNRQSAVRDLSKIARVILVVG